MSLRKDITNLTQRLHNLADTYNNKADTTTNPTHQQEMRGTATAYRLTAEALTNTLKGAKMTTPTPTKTLSDYITSWIRTTVPVAWGALLTWLATLIPPIGDLLNSQAATGFNVVIAGALTIAWYSLWRKSKPTYHPGPHASS
jgi:hypothetical protein